MDKKKKLIAKLLHSKAGRKRLAAAMNKPLREYRDYEAVGRRAFLVDPLGDGELPYYDKDLDTTALVIGEDAVSIRQVPVGIDRVFVPLFEVATSVTIPYTKLKEKRYDVQTRVREKSKSDIFRAEDRKIFSVFKALVTANNAENPVQPVSRASISYDDISDAMGLVEQHNNKVANVFINGKNITIFRKALKDIFEPITVSEIIKSGVVGTFNGAIVNVSPEVPEDMIFFTAEKEFTGRLVESIPLTVLEDDSLGERAVGFSIFEYIGILAQGKAVSAIQLT